MSASKSYAQALFESADGKKNTQVMSGAIRVARELASHVRESRELKTLLESPSFSAQDKVTALSGLLKKMGSDDKTSTWINLIVQKGRALFLDEIADELEKFCAEAEGKVVGNVVSSEWIDEQELKSLTQSFEKKIGKPVFLRQQKDESLLAGLKVTIGGLTYDGTLRTQLNQLKERFVEYKTKGMN